MRNLEALFNPAEKKDTSSDDWSLLVLVRSLSASNVPGLHGYVWARHILKTRWLQHLKAHTHRTTSD